MDEVEFGRYRLIALIGQGGMGKVYRAHDTVMGRDVAVKVLSPELAAESDYEHRFRREALTAARLSEPHIIPIFEAGEIDGRLYLVMPIIDGIDVQTLLQRDGPMSAPRAVQVIEQLAAALSAAHEHGLVHRDVKPSNALVTGDDFVYLIDFGIVQDLEAGRLTSTGMMVGTLAYMAPERFTDGAADARSDVYALTCVLYECLTGKTPYPGSSLEQQISGHLTSEPPRPTQQRPDLPAGFDHVIAKGMTKAPDQRYQSARELATAARRVLDDNPVLTRRPPPAHSVRNDPPSAPVWPEARPRPAAEPGWQWPAGAVGVPAHGYPPMAAGLASAPRQGRAGLIAVLVASLAIVAVVIGVLGYVVLKQHDSAARTQTSQPAPPSAATAQPAPSAPAPPASTTGSAIPGLTPFVGIWQAHTQRVVIDTSGAGQLTYQGCTSCPTQTVNTVDFTLTSVANGVATGSVTTTTDPYYSGKPVTAMIAAGSPGLLLELTIGGLLQGALCNSVAEAAGECGA